MSLIPEVSIAFWNGWWFSLIYFIVNRGMPLFRKDSHKRLLTAANSQNFFWRRINMLIWFTSVGLPVFMPIKTGSVVFYSGMLIFFVGMVLNIIALWNYITTPPDQPVTKGLYKYSRNPIYVVYGFTWYGVGLALGSWLLIIINTIKLFTSHCGILEEENYCLQKYGEEFRCYINKVPRYF
ncbi:hypothetical protein SOV_30090 [Sporomusa ovata DSM 2662]|nr:methyltransferase [Sporomusa ovata]EQB24978.1 phospholipid methyltransferase [Sporomusa ovata DSM 2662]